MELRIYTSYQADIIDVAFKKLKRGKKKKITFVRDYNSYFKSIKALRQNGGHFEHLPTSKEKKTKRNYI